MSFGLNLLTPTQAQNYINTLQSLIQQQGYVLVGQTQTLVNQCNGNPAGRCSISYSTTLLERPATGSYFLIVPVKWGSSFNAPPDSALCYNFSSKAVIEVYGIRQISSSNTVKTLITSFDATGYLYTNLVQCDQIDTTPYNNDYYITVLGLGDRYYSLANITIPLLVHETFDSIELDVTIQIENALDSSCLNSYYAQCYLEISNVLVYYLDITSFLNNLSLILSLLSFLLGVL